MTQNSKNAERETLFDKLLEVAVAKGFGHTPDPAIHLSEEGLLLKHLAEGVRYDDSSLVEDIPPGSQAREKLWRQYFKQTFGPPNKS